MSRTTRAFRRNAAAHHGNSVEFAELLDAIGTATILLADPVTPTVNDPAPIEPIHEPVPVELAHEIVEEPMPVSRFADAGLDDDRLPVRSTARHGRRR